MEQNPNNQAQMSNLKFGFWHLIFFLNPRILEPYLYAVI